MSAKEREGQLKEILSDYYKEKEKANTLSDKKGKVRLTAVYRREVFIKVGVILIIGLSFHLSLSAIEEAAIWRKPIFWAKGTRRPTDVKINECIFKLWQIRKAVDIYYTDRRSFPKTIDSLYVNGYLSKEIVCPVSGRRYIVKEIEARSTFSCPNPYKHGVEELYCSLKGGAPIIKRK